MSLKNKNICVTGGAGFLGRHVLPVLKGAGASVTCLIRHSGMPESLDVRLVRGDCETGAGLEEAFRDQDILIHMAGRLFGCGWQDYLRANGRAAENIVRILARPGVNGPRKVIFVSSLAAAGPCAAPPGLDGDCAPAPVSAYGWSKLLAEQILGSADLSLTILRPPIIYGSGDKGLLPVFKSAAHGFGISPGCGRKFPVSVIHADDAARAIALAADNSVTGTFHLCDGKIYDMADICESMGRALGRDRVRTLRMPLSLMAVTASAGSIWGLVLSRLAAAAGKNPGRPPAWNFDKYRESAQTGWLADYSLIRARMGFEPGINLEEGMAETVAGYRAEGWI